MATNNQLLSATRIKFLKAQGYCNLSDAEKMGSDTIFMVPVFYPVFPPNEMLQMSSLGFRTTMPNSA
jgi:hypothetical protein